MSLTTWIHLRASAILVEVVANWTLNTLWSFKLVAEGIIDGWDNCLGKTNPFHNGKASIAGQTSSIVFVVGLAVGVDGLADSFRIHVVPGWTGNADSTFAELSTTWIEVDDVLGEGGKKEGGDEEDK